MKIFRYLLPACFGLVFVMSCLDGGSPTSSDNTEDSLRIADSIREADSLRAADSIHIADSLLAAEAVRIEDSIWTADSIHTADSLAAIDSLHLFPCDSTLDQDKDDLNDCDELNVYGTSPRIKDTDGDGMDDRYEVMESSSNPLVADMPLLDIEFTSSPYIYLQQAQTHSEQSAFSTQMSQSVSRNVSTGRTMATNTETAIENEISTKVSIGIKTLFEGAEISTSSRFGLTMSRQASFSTEQAMEATREYARVEELVRMNEVVLTGGEISVDAALRNVGPRAFRLKNLTVAARAINPADGTFQTLLTLTPQGWTETSLGPLTKEKSVQLKGTTDDWARIQYLRRYPRGLVFSVTGFDMEHEAGDFAFTEEAVQAKTALVVIDYGGYRDVERFLVATNVAWENGKLPGVKMEKVFNDILEIPYNIGGEDSSVISIRDIDNNLAQNEHWVVVTSAASSGGGFDALTLKAGDFANIIFIRDNDGDGVSAREEFLYGASDEKADTDEDGLGDYFEIKTGWRVPGISAQVYPNPVLSGDYDGDSLNDRQERDLATNPYSPDTDGDGIYDDSDPIPNTPQISEINFRVASAQYNRVNLRWSPPDTADTSSYSEAVIIRMDSMGYIFDRPEDGQSYQAGDTLGGCFVVYSGTDSILRDTLGIRQNSEYTYRIFLKYGSGYNEGISVQATTPWGPLANVSNAQIQYIDNGPDVSHTIRLSWNNAFDDPRVEAIIIVRSDSGKVTQIPADDQYDDYTPLPDSSLVVTRKTVSDIGTSFEDENLWSFTTYHYRIFTVGAGEVSTGIALSPVTTAGKVNIHTTQIKVTSSDDAYNAGCACYRSDFRISIAVTTDAQSTPYSYIWISTENTSTATTWARDDQLNVYAKDAFNIVYDIWEDDTSGDDAIYQGTDAFNASDLTNMLTPQFKDINDVDGSLDIYYQITLLPLSADVD